MAVKRKKAPSTPKLYNFYEMQSGVLYKVYKTQFETLYTKSLQGDIVWLENGRIGTYSRGEYSPDFHPAATQKYVIADVGDGYTIEQDACILV